MLCTWLPHNLAAALGLYNIYDLNFYFVSDDGRQCDAAAAEGCHVLKPREDESLKFLESLAQSSEEEAEGQD